MPQPNINALCVSISLGIPPPPAGMTLLHRNVARQGPWPAWLENWVSEDTGATDVADPATIRKLAVLHMNDVPIKVSLANCPSAPQLMLLLERVQYLKERGLERRTLERWCEIVRARIVHYKLEPDFDASDRDACRLCEDHVRVLLDLRIVAFDS